METKETTPDKIQRTFIIGEEWLYYKFYSGSKTADLLLTEMIKPAAEKLLVHGNIDKWFFIRFSDPGVHIRVRFHLVKPDFLSEAALLLQSLCRPFVDQDLVWKVQVDSYQREIERYGVETMTLSEDLFFHDSRMMTAMLDMIAGDEGEKFRWLFAVRALDALLDDFQFDLERKSGLLGILKNNFGREFGIDRSLRDQLKEKYRSDREAIEIVLDRSQDEKSEMKPLFDLLAQRSQDIRSIAAEILSIVQTRQMQPQLNDIVGSYIHMMLNRVFRSKQRVHELVIYDFLWNHYKSVMARQKHDKKEKKD